MAGPPPPQPFKWGDRRQKTILKNIETFYETFNAYILNRFSNVLPENKKLQMALKYGGEDLRECLMQSVKQDIFRKDAKFSEVFEEALVILKPFEFGDYRHATVLFNFEQFYERFNGYILSRYSNGEAITENEKLSLALEYGGEELRKCLTYIGMQDVSNDDAKFSEVLEETLIILKQNIVNMKKAAKTPPTFKLGDGNPETIHSNFETFYESINEYILSRYSNALPVNRKLYMALDYGGRELKMCLTQDISWNDRFSNVFEETLVRLKHDKERDNKAAPQPFEFGDYSHETVLNNFETFYKSFNDYILLWQFDGNENRKLYKALYYGTWYILSRYSNGEMIREKDKLFLALEYGGKELRECLTYIGKQDISHDDAKFSEVWEETLIILKQNIVDMNKAATTPPTFEFGDGNPETIQNNFETFYESINEYILSRYSNALPENRKLHMALEYGGRELSECLIMFGKQEILNDDAKFSEVFQETLEMLRKNNRTISTGGMAPQPFNYGDGSQETILNNFEIFYEGFNEYFLSRYNNTEMNTEHEKLSVALAHGGRDLRECLTYIGNQNISNDDAKFSKVFEVTLAILNHDKVSWNMAGKVRKYITPPQPFKWGDGRPDTILNNFEVYYEGLKNHFLVVEQYEKSGYTSEWRKFYAKLKE